MMNMKKLATVAAAGALLFVTLASTPATAQSNNNFTALQGVEAQTLTPQEMAAISGALNAYDIAAALTTLAASLGSNPKLQASLLTLANYYSTNAAKINAFYMKLGIFTPCKTCAP
jgi:galactitol-specific phosphotransferase system IIB component